MGSNEAQPHGFSSSVVTHGHHPATPRMASEKANAATDEGDLKVGDHVEWKSRVAHREGHITEKLTHDRDGTRASEANPKFVVVDEGRGKEYARNPDKLHKVDDNAA